MSRFLATVLLVAGFSLGWAAQATAAGRVELELATEEGFPATETQRWYRLFTELKVDGLTIRGRRATDKVEIVTTGKGDNALYHVTGVLTKGNEVILPGGKFSQRDQGRLAAWLTKVAEGGPGQAAVPRPFALEPGELAQVRKDLAQPVGFSTKGRDRGEALTAILKQLALPAAAEGSLDTALAEAGTVNEELSGLASGTAAAYLLRPAGLGIAPRKSSSGSLEYVLFTADGSRDRWPVGLPAEEQRDKILPKMMEFLTIEIEDVPLPQVLEALSKRLETPMLVDHVALAKRKIEIDKTKVTLPGKRTTYSLALRKLLGQARLKSELRIDDAGKPFFWVTTMIPAE